MKKVTVIFLAAVLLSSCSRTKEMTLEEIQQAKALNESSAVHKPYLGQTYAAGQTGGIWYDVIGGDPKSFNFLIAERDGETAGILAPLNDYLVDYDVIQKKWVPRIASYEIKVNKDSSTMDVIYTLRDDLYWSFYNDSKPKVKVTADDVVFWYNEIYCDKEMGSSAYNSQFIELDNGETGLVTIEKLSQRKFAFHFPTLIADPVLFTNMNFGPAFIYKKAKDEGGADAVKNLHTVDMNPQDLPSMGTYFITEYLPGQRVVYERNPDYWNKDSNGISVNYPEKNIAQIAGDSNLRLLLFQEGKTETYSPSPDRVYDLLQEADKYDYTVFAADGSYNASFWSFNQNPQNEEWKCYKWFTKKEFRQAMSCLLNRDRICLQVYRGMAEPKYDFFPEANAFYDKTVELDYKFDRERAVKLLESIGIKRADDGLMYDTEGNRIEFDLSVASENTTGNKIAQIITDECRKTGITINVRQTDFQALVEQLTDSYDWQSIIIGLGGGSLFPTQGSNVWVTTGNLHLWYPLQESPATEWEGRVDELYNSAKCIVNSEKARPYWKEYQQIILEQCPVIYLCRSKSYFAIHNKWDLTNVYYDNMSGALTDKVYLRQ